MTRKILYLFPSTPVHILRDGPALRLRQAEQADRLYPLRKLAMIVSSSQVQWDTHALVLCAVNGITIHFVNKQGEIHGHLQPAIDHDPNNVITTCFESYLNLPDCAIRYRRWMRIQYHEINHIRVVEHPEKNLRNCLMPYVRMADYRRFEKHMHHFTVLQLHEIIIEKGIDIHHPVASLANINLANDFAGLLLEKYRQDRYRFIKHMGHKAQQHGDLKARIHLNDTITFFEEKRKTLENDFEHYFRLFYQHMLESVKEHALPI